MKRATSVHELESRMFDVMDFTGEFEQLIGKPELTGAWIVWGSSANGKTNFTLQLAKYLTNFKRVAYNSLEEGVSQSLKKSIKRTGLRKTKNQFTILEDRIEELKERLRHRRSPDVVIIDSLQYTGLTYAQYRDLKQEFKNKLFIFISHEDGKLPEGAVGKKIRYDAPVKIRIEGYVATARSRFLDGEGKEYTIWRQGAEEYWIKMNEK